MTSLYFDTKITIPDEPSSSSHNHNRLSSSSSNSAAGFGGKRIFLETEWHPHFPLLAISHTDERSASCVSVYDHLNDETTNIDSTTSSSSSAQGPVGGDAVGRPSLAVDDEGSQITAMKWHPLKKILALGHEGGEVVIWNHSEGESFEGARGHNAAIMLMEWSGDGSLLVSSDNMGILIIWKADSQTGHVQTHFIHDFKDPVCHIVFRQPGGGPGSEKDTGKDETSRALGQMTNWRPKTGKASRTPGGGGRHPSRPSLGAPSPPEEKSFFVGVLSGTIYYLRESGSNEEILSSGSSIRSLLYHPRKDVLIILTEAQIMGHFSVSESGDLVEVNKMKVGGRGEMHLFWVGLNTLAVIGRDPTVRLWDVESAVNSVLEPKLGEVGEEESFRSLDYSRQDGILACATSRGKLIMWKEKEGVDQTEEGAWTPLPTTVIPSSTKSAKWCPGTAGLLAVNAVQDVLLLRETELCFSFTPPVAVVQTQPSVLCVQSLNNKSLKSFELRVDMQIKGVTSSSSTHHIVLWNGVKVLVYEGNKFLSSFGSKAEAILVHDASLYLQEAGSISVRSFQGTIKQTLAFSSSEGPPVTLALGGDYLTSATEFGWLKVWHVGRREAKLHLPPKNLHEVVENLGEVMSANTNVNGMKVGFTVALNNLVPDSRFYVYDIPSQTLSEVVFPLRFVEKFYWEAENPSYVALEVKTLPPDLQAVLENEAYEALRREERQVVNKVKRAKFIKDCAQIRRPWGLKEAKEGDHHHHHVAVASKTGVPGSSSIARRVVEIDLPSSQDAVIVTLFADSDRGILVHEKRTDLSNLVGLQVPYIYTAVSTSDVRLSVQKSVIPEFDGVEDEGKEGRAALLKYVFHTLFSDVDGALRAVRVVQNERIYANMVRACVVTGRLDIGLLCLARGKEARVAREVRSVMEAESEAQAAVAMLAIQLGMLGDAERLLKEASRFDLLLSLYVSWEAWDKAVQLCERHRRIQLRSTHHAHGKAAEYDRKISEAVENYEKAETHRVEVPRMLVDEGVLQLETYVLKAKDKDLFQYWAQYLESTGDDEGARVFYEHSQDWLSLVRLLCCMGAFEKAVAVSAKVGDRASAYHLARFLEDAGDVPSAVSFFARAEAWGHGIKLCMANQLDDELWGLAQRASGPEMAEAAKYFEPLAPGRAIQLYHKAGYESKALEMAFSLQEFGALQAIVRDMGSGLAHTDPLLLQKCADFFVQNGEVAKALDMLAAAGKYQEAMDLCVSSNYTITDELAERLTAPKAHGLEETARIALLEKMGECLTLQGSYHLAAKKYTQAGNKISAIKSLIKSGDTERIMYYAHVSRHRDIYLMAAHYLQTIDWRKDPGKILPAIETYYRKAAALESLAGFYEAVAEAEIPDYRRSLEELRKASNIWKEVLSYGSRQYEDRFASVEAKIANVSKFLKIKETFRFDVDAAAGDLKKLMIHGEVEGIRTGDMYGLVVEQSVKGGDVEGAVNLLEKMRDFTKGKSLTHFLSPETVQKLEDALESSPSLMRVRSGSEAKVSSKTPSAGYLSEKLPPPPRNLDEDEDEEDEEVDEEEEVEEVLSNEEDEDEDEEDEDEEVIYKRTTNATTSNNSYT